MSIQYRTREVYCYKCGRDETGDIVENAYGYDHIKCHGCKWTATYPQA